MSLVIDYISYIHKNISKRVISLTYNKKSSLNLHYLSLICCSLIDSNANRIKRSKIVYHNSKLQLTNSINYYI